MNTVKIIEDLERGSFAQVATPEEFNAAEFYQEKFVPALFACWSAPLIEAAQIEPGQRVLDIACGTGVVTRDIDAIVGQGQVPVGLDISAGMLAVAQSLSPAIEWRQASADSLPFPEQSFDRVVCQFGLMFFPDPVKALREMLRVLKPGGRLAVSVWNSLESNSGFRDKVDILEKTAGARAAAALKAPFCLGDEQHLETMAEMAEIENYRRRSLTAQASFRNLGEFVDAELRGWLPVMQVHLSEQMIQTIHHECEIHMAGYIDHRDDSFEMPTSAHIFTGNR